jgi:hypothetical protein
MLRVLRHAYVMALVVLTLGAIHAGCELESPKEEVGDCTNMQLAECDDSNPCTFDTCVLNEAGGFDCRNTNDDGRACDVMGVGGTCSEGVCEPACTSEQEAACDDGNPCTVNACVLDQNTPTCLDPTNRPDGSACAVSEMAGTCQAGVCDPDFPPPPGGDAVWDGGGGDNLWTNGLNWESDVVPGPGDRVVIADSSAAVRLDVTEPAIVRSLNLTAGSLTIGRGELRLQDASSVQGDLSIGPPAGAGVGPSLSLTGSLEVSGSLECRDGQTEGGVIRVVDAGIGRFQNCLLAGSDLINAGDVTLAASVTIGSDSSIENQASGTIALEAASIGCQGVECTGSVVNAGQMLFTGFVASVAPRLDNSGAIELESTQVSFASGVNSGDITSTATTVNLGGDWTNELGSSFATRELFVASGLTVVTRGTLTLGTLRIQSGAEVRLTSSTSVMQADEVEVSGGSLVLAPNVELESDDVWLFDSGQIEVGTGGILYVRGRMRWSSGVLTGGGSTRVISDLVTDPTPSLLLDGTEGRSLDGHRLLVVGPTTWADGDIQAGNGAEFNNFQSSSGVQTGLVRVQSDNAFLGAALGGVIAVWLNQGVIRKEGGSGETLIDGCYQTTNGGTIIEDVGTVRVEVRCSP